MWKKYKKKPLVIEALKITQRFYDSCIRYQLSSIDGVFKQGDNYFIVRTLEGDMKADVGDYIIRGIKGELYPCKPDIFKKTYEKLL